MPDLRVGVTKPGRNRIERSRPSCVIDSGSGELERVPVYPLGERRLGRTPNARWESIAGLRPHGVETA